MNRTVQRIGAVGLIGATSFALVGCGSSSEAAPAPASTTTTVPSTTPASSTPATTAPATTPPSSAPASTIADNPASDQLVDRINDPTVSDIYVDLEQALADYDTFAAQLPDDLQTWYQQLKDDIAHAAPLHGPDGVDAYAAVKDDVDVLTMKIEALDSTQVQPEVINAWAKVKTEFDNIDGGI